jgi:hypothetical protein
MRQPPLLAPKLRRVRPNPSQRKATRFEPLSRWLRVTRIPAPPVLLSRRRAASRAPALPTALRPRWARPAAAVLQARALEALGKCA